MIPREVIEEIKRRLDIVDVVSEYINLERVGKNYRALCPFHTETRPSFYVSPELQRYKCFGCGASGDVISFVQQMENISFYEALEKLAKKAGVDISKYKRGGGEYSRYVSFMEELRKIYVKELWLSSEALSYMKDRGFSEEDLKKFEIGYSPVGSDIPVEIARRMGLGEDFLERSGVVAKRQGRFADLFEGRVIFPIKNESGATVAFGGRVIGEGEPKYINSRDTKYFSKSRILYMLDRAKSRIRNLDIALVTEGYMDALALHRGGFDNSVAVLGTALTSHHASRLSGLTKNVVLALDSDDSGKRAVLRSLEMLIARGFDILVVNWPRKDADETLAELGREGLEKAIENAITYEEFIAGYFAEMFDLSKASGLERYAKVIGEWAGKIESVGTSARAKALLEKASELSGVPLRDFQRFVRGEVIEEGETEKFDAEDEILLLFFNEEELREEILSMEEDLFSDRMKEFLRLYREKGDLNSALEEASNEIGDWVFKVLKDLPPPSDPKKAFEDAKKRLEVKKLQKRLEEIDGMLNEVGPEERKVLLGVRMDIVRKIKALQRG